VPAGASVITISVPHGHAIGPKVHHRHDLLMSLSFSPIRAGRLEKWLRR
jgi:hypothetical protein